MSPNRYTELFFLDEATALAAGHRPCFECRRGDFVRFRDAWAAGNGWTSEHPPRVADMDGRLHRERVDGHTRRQRTWRGRLEDLPDGDRKSGGAGKGVSERVVHGGRRSIKKKKK